MAAPHCRFFDDMGACVASANAGAFPVPVQDVQKQHRRITAHAQTGGMRRSGSLRAALTGEGNPFYNGGTDPAGTAEGHTCAQGVLPYAHLAKGSVSQPRSAGLPPESVEKEGVSVTPYEKSLQVMQNLFAKDCQFALATSVQETPSVRVVDTFFSDGAFYVVSYAQSQKVKALESNPQVALCSKAHRFRAFARNVGHPLAAHNLAIRDQLRVAFAPWYSLHNNEGDENMCYLKIEPTWGFFYQDGVGYEADFTKQAVKTFPFTLESVTVD